MKKNIGTTDRTIRIIAGIIIIALGVWFKSWWGLIGLLPLATALIGWCPPYALLGISTCRNKEQSA
jgi:predicted RND superfamily exporter protein